MDQTITDTEAQHNKPTTPEQVLCDIFADRARVIAARVRIGDLPLIEGVDFIYSAAVWSGLVDRLGDDRIQSIMASAFGGKP